MHVAVHAVLVFSLFLASAGSASGQEGTPSAPAPTRPDSTAPAPPPARPDSAAPPAPSPARPDSAATRSAPAAPPRAERPKPPAPNPWKFSAEFSYTDQSGNKALSLLTSGLKFSHRDKKAFELDGNLQSRYGKSEGEVVARNYFGTLNFSPRATSLWAPSLSLKAERDPFKRLDLRFSGGAGARFTPYKPDTGSDQIAISVRLAYEYTNLRETPDGAEAEVQHRPRWTMEVRGTQEIRSGITAQHQSAFEPSWGELANYLLRSQTGMKILLTKRLALSVEHQLSRTNRPPVGVEPDDRLFKTGIIIDF